MEALNFFTLICLFYRHISAFPTAFVVAICYSSKLEKFHRGKMVSAFSVAHLLCIPAGIGTEEYLDTAQNFIICPS